MKEKARQLFKDKLVLVMMVLGLLTIVAASGTMTIHRGGQTEETPYLQMQESPGMIAENEEFPAETAGQPAELPAGEMAGEEKIYTEERVADASEKDELSPAETYEEDAAQAGAGQASATALTLNFTESSRMTWPIQGNVLLDYSMDTTIYFPTLDQYKCNPGIVIQGEVSMPVVAPANAQITEIGNNEEIGNYAVLDLGNEYTVTCGQLKEIQAEAGDYLEKGQILGYVAEPTKYYCVEGSNVYMEMDHQGAPVDPLDFME